MPVSLSEHRKILIIRMRYIGDVILTTPLLKTLKTGIPGVQTHMLVNRGTEAVLNCHPHADKVFCFDYEKAENIRYAPAFIIRLRKEKYDAVIDLTGNDRSALFTRLSGARLRIGYAGENRLRSCLAYNRQIQAVLGSIHTVDHHLKAAEIFGLRADDIHPFIPVTSDQKSRVDALLSSQGINPSESFAIIHPGARRPYKSWPPERFALVGDYIIRNCGIRLILSGSRKDENLCAEIGERMKEKAMNLAGLVSLTDLPALISKSRCLIGNDSAPIHISTAVSTPVIALFGPTDGKIWGPRREQDRILDAEFPCRPCGHSRTFCPLGEHYCMSAISFASVRDAVEDVLKNYPA